MADAGTALASAPIGSILRDLAFAVADAQERLDESAIEAAKRLASTDNGVEIGSGASARTATLIELGFAPTFYSFVEADLEVVLETRIQQETNVGASGELTAKTAAVGMTMSVEFQRKFAVDTSGHTRVTAKLIALPPPTRFLEALGGT